MSTILVPTQVSSLYRIEPSDTFRLQPPDVASGIWIGILIQSLPAIADRIPFEDHGVTWDSH